MRCFSAVLVGVFALASAATGTSATPSGVSGRVSLSLQATTPKGQSSLAGAATFARRGSFVRIELQSLSLTKTNSVLSAIPPGGYVVVYDTATMVYTIWSPSRRTFYTGGRKPPTAATTPAPVPTAAPSAPPGNSIWSVLAGVKDLRGFALSLSLSPDKTPIDGHPTTNFDFTFTRQVKAQDPVDVSGRATFADDLDGVPLLFVVNATNGPTATLRADLRVSLSDVSRRSAPQSYFAPPSGYTRVSSIFDVIVIPGLPSGSSTSP
ncbi:MAG: hypothetical protein ABI346_05875 [Candidatus Baltobacteraceae bacterium]